MTEYLTFVYALNGLILSAMVTGGKVHSVFCLQELQMLYPEEKMIMWNKRQYLLQILWIIVVSLQYFPFFEWCFVQRKVSCRLLLSDTYSLFIGELYGFHSFQWVGCCNWFSRQDYKIIRSSEDRHFAAHPLTVRSKSLDFTVT